MTKKKVFLSPTEKFKLNKWIEEHKEYAKNTPDRAIAEASSLDLGFTVLESHVQAARKTVGVRKYERRPRIKLVDFDVHTVALNVMLLMRSLGVTPIGDIVRLAELPGA